MLSIKFNKRIVHKESSAFMNIIRAGEWWFGAKGVVFYSVQRTYEKHSVNPEHKEDIDKVLIITTD